ncbi:MAG: AI-2E family transporter [Pseudomonadota bacterium]
MERSDISRLGDGLETKRKTALQGSLQNAFYAMGLALMGGWLLYIGRGIIVPFVLAAIVAYVIVGLAHFLSRVPWIGAHVPSWLRNLASMLAIGLVIASLVSLIVTNANAVAAVIPRYQDQLLSLIQTIAILFGVQEEQTWTTLRDQILAQIEFRPLIQTALSSMTQVLAVTAVVFIYCGFLLAERATFGAKLDRVSRDPETTADINAILSEVNERIGTYLALKTFVNIVLGLISWIMMSLVGVEFAAFWAVLIGLLNYIPYLGSFVGVFFPVVLSAMQFGDIGAVLLVLIVLSAAQIFVGSILEPYVMGNSLNLSPTVILLGLAIWSALWGVAGAILSVPIMASLVIVLASFEGTRPMAVMLSRNGQVGGDAIHRSEGYQRNVAATRSQPSEHRTADAG